MWVLERFGLRILGDPSQTIATAMLFQTITPTAWPYRPKIPHPGEISGLESARQQIADKDALIGQRLIMAKDLDGEGARIECLIGQ
jgi:hypothetical protein